MLKRFNAVKIYFVKFHFYEHKKIVYVKFFPLFYELMRLIYVDLIHLIDPVDIYNGDELGLFWRMQGK